MKIERIYPKVIITKKGERWLNGGHPWVYASDLSANQLYSAEDDIPNGSIVDVMTESGKYMGSGFYSLKSKIRVRLVSRNANDKFDAEFWRRRIGYALDYRLTVMQEDIDAFRVFFGESDDFYNST